MTKRRQAVSPMADVIAKKIFNDHEITIDFINTFLGFRPKSVQILNGTLADVKKKGPVTLALRWIFWLEWMMGHR